MSAYLELEHPWFESDLAPVYVWTFPRSPSLEEVAECLDARERFLERIRYDTAWVMDLSYLTGPDARRRRLASEHMLRAAPYDAHHNRGCAVVVPNAVVRGMLSAVFWLSPPRFPCELTETRGDALEWALSRVR